MTVFPVIRRELRAQARQPFTHASRLLGVGGLIFAGAWFVADNAMALSMNQNIGRDLFQFLHRALFISICLLVPFSAADCISRERREGTLGLLFLTPLRARDIVLAKGFAHGFRALCLIAAVLPVFAIPFLLGGVTWQQVTVSLLVNLNAVCVTLGFSLVASAMNKEWTRSLVMSLSATIVLFWCLAYASGVLLVQNYLPFMRGTGFPRQASLADVLNDISLDRIQRMGLSLGGFSSYLDWFMGGLPGALPLRPAVWTVVEVCVFCSLVLVAGIFFAAFRLRRVWQEEPPSARQLWIRRTFFTPRVGLVFYRNWMRRLLERNPVGWLERRTWQGRVLTWAWFAIIISFYSALMTERSFYRGMEEAHVVIGWLLAMSMAVGAAGSFRRERESGVLELLLVTPMSTDQIVWGRLKGVWGQFIPAVGTFLLLWFYVASLFPHEHHGGSMVSVAFTFLSLPAIGLYFSLRSAGFVGAFMLTMLWAAVIPNITRLVCWIGLELYFNGYVPSEFIEGVLPLIVPGMQVCFAIHFLRRLRQRLESRSFKLEHA